MFTQTWCFKSKKVEKNLAKSQKEPENGTQLDNRCILTLKTNIAMLGFSVKTILLDRKMPFSQIPSKNCGKNRFIT